ncbi:MAG: THUMP domain-containing protein [Spirochaetales bacterium]|jgi:putative N6-adenine-specific DNA methylase|nr:THUMP domain-containing protein [Spirochaetales bacterium]
MKTADFPMTAKTLPGLEDVLAEELKTLGARDILKQKLAVSFRGDTALLYQANLCLRTALRVLVPLREFHAETTSHIYSAAYDFPWETYLGPGGSLAVDAAVNSRTFTHGSYCALKVKDAVCDHFLKKSGRRPDVDTASPSLRINLWIHGEEGVLSVDASGESLHRRGYRLEKTEAPLSEVLAAGILLLTGWDRVSPLHDPMCGSGTFLTEAGLMSAGIPPLALREKFGFMGWKTFDPALWKTVRTDALPQKREPRARISGADSDPRAVEITRGNIQRAGLEQCISVTRAAFEKSPPPENGPGCVLMNPPYGKRMRSEEITALYSRIGDTLKTKYSGWTGWVFSSNLEALKHTGLRSFRRIPLKNGPLDCRLAGFKLFQGNAQK